MCSNYSNLTLCHSLWFVLVTILPSTFDIISSLWAVSRLNGGLLARNHFYKDLSHRIKLSGINERVGAVVEKTQKKITE